VGPPRSLEGLPLAALADPANLHGMGYAAVQALGPTPSSSTDLAAAVAANVSSLSSDPQGFFKALRARLPSTSLRTVVLQEPLSSKSAGVSAAADAATFGASDLRRTQLALQKLGYYGGKVDGVAGADTLAAIRRFQHELRAEMSGRLTPDQLERLLKDSQ
jgi:hypothetical protein